MAENIMWLKEIMKHTGGVLVEVITEWPGTDRRHST